MRRGTNPTVRCDLDRSLLGADYYSTIEQGSVEYSSGSVSETCVMTSFYIDTLEDERRVCCRDRNGVDRAIDITWE